MSNNGSNYVTTLPQVAATQAVVYAQTYPIQKPSLENPSPTLHHNSYTRYSCYGNTIMKYQTNDKP